MAAVLLIWGAVTIRERVEKKAEEKRLKKERDAVRYAELQQETERRLSWRRSDGGNHPVVGDVLRDEEGEREEDRWWEEPSTQVPAHEPVATRQRRDDAIPGKKSTRRRRGIKSFLRPTPA